MFYGSAHELTEKNQSPMKTRRNLVEGYPPAAENAARSMPKRTNLSDSGSEVARREKKRLETSFGEWLKFSLVHLCLGLVALVVAYEVAQFILGSCQGYSGVAAFERSIFGQHLNWWSVDPLRC